MSMDLAGAGGDFHCNNLTWECLLRLAEANGWRPEGTRPPRRLSKNWSGSYGTNDGQRVTARDAANLAEALERALPDIPDHDALAHKTRAIELADGQTIRVLTDPDAVSPVEYLSGKGKQLVKEFIRFSRAGSFRIR